MATGKDSALERLTVNLTQRTSRAMRLGTRLSGDTKTDVVNRYIQIGAYVEWLLSQPGDRILVQHPGDEQPFPLRLLPGSIVTGAKSFTSSAQSFDAVLDEVPPYED